jgi:drug/metabolite transporter (DMT)-like permease
MTDQNKAYFYAGLSVLCWSTVATAFKIALDGQSYINLLFFSSFTSIIALAIILISKKQSKIDISKQSIINSSIMGFLNPFLYYIVLFKAYSLLPAQSALTLNYTWAIVIVIFSIIFLKQKIGITSVLGILISFFGVIFIATKGNLFDLNFENKFGTFLASGSSIIWGLYWILNIKDKRNEIEKLFLNFLFGLIFIMIYIVLFDKIEITSTRNMLANIYIGLFEMGLTFVFWMSALKYSSDTSKVSNIIYISPFASLFIISLVLNEKIEFYSYIGLIMIIFGIVFPNIKLIRKH